MSRIPGLLLLALLLPAAALAQHGEPIQLTDDPGLNGYAEWSPDGSYLLYTTEAEGKEGLWKVSVEGGEPERFCAYRSHHARFSPDGRYVLYDGEAGTRVMVIAASGGVPIRVVGDERKIEMSANSVWAPDGRRIVFRSENALHVLDLPTGEITLAHDAGERIPIPMYWSLDGQSIFAGLFQREPRDVDLWRIPLDGGEPEQLTFHGDVMKMTASPDERWIVFDSRKEGSADLWAMPFAGGAAVRLTTEDSHEMEPRWSRQGNRLAYMSTRGGPPDLWVMDLDVAWFERELGGP